MNRLQKMTPILELAERAETRAAKILGECQQRLETARKGLENLASFRRSYSEQFEQTGQQGLSVHRLTEFRAFLHKINKAVAEQERVIKHTEEELALLRRSWEEAHSKVLGLQKVVGKLVAEVEAQEQRREQIEQDDRIGSRRGGGGKTLLSALL